MELIIGSDLVPTEVNINLFEQGNIEALLGTKLGKLWINTDFRTFNLETPLTDEISPINKQGPNLIAPTSTINGIKALDPSLVTLANNHILDHGEQGLYMTVNLLDKHEIPNIGAGANLNDAKKPHILNYNKKKIGFYTCAEHEFTIATDDSPGANPFDPLESLDHIQDLKSQCDYVIVLYHGGKEHYRYPSPELQRVCRKIVEKGADLVVCQHSHCIGSFEEYNNATIVYGQGNFIFNKHDNEYWNTSLLIKVTIGDGLSVEYIPVVRNEIGIELANHEESEVILGDFHKRSEQILQEGFIKKQYIKFAEEELIKYIRRFAGFGKWKSRLDYRLFNHRLLKNHYTKQQLLALQNYIECEAHRELLLVGLKGEIKSG